MDILRRAYEDDDEDDVEEEDLHAERIISAAKRLRSDVPSHWAEPFPMFYPDHHHPSFDASPPLPPPPSIAGRYVSRRERVRLAAARPRPLSDPVPSVPVALTSPVVGSISQSSIPSDVWKSLMYERNGRGELNRHSERLTITLNSNDSAVNTIKWSQAHVHLLASAGMDHKVSVWNVWSKENKLARVFSSHNAAVKDFSWSPLGLSLLSCGYDCSSRLVDVERGIETQLFQEDHAVMAVRFHPLNPMLFLSGGSKGSLKLWDIRTGEVVKNYFRNLGPILDIEFSRNGEHFISSSDISGSNASENAIIVWDVLREVPLSNQVYTEAYTCPCIRYHPFEASFIAQSNADYIAIFSARPPFKLDKYRRYEKHSVSGFPIKCSFSLDGKEIASGSADGCMYFYNYRSSELSRKIKAYDDVPCVDVAYHPRFRNVIASCSWKGDITVFE